jgi:predicted amidophosphoribosyltransferase
MGFSIKLIPFYKHVIQSLLNLLYPPLCLHCKALLPQRNVLFCPSCLESISLIEPQGRCRTCFAELNQGRCKRCMKRRVVVQRQIAACEAFGPTNALLQGVLNAKRETIPAAASLMAYQWLALKMPLPDVLVPLPTSFWQRQRFGFDPHGMLAHELGKILAVPVYSLLNRRFDWEQFLTQGEFHHRVLLKKNQNKIVCDRRVLIVAPLLDDVRLRSIGKELKPHFPAQIDALAFASFVE